MKKILLFILLSFFISSVSYSKIITLKDCYSELQELKSFNKDVYEDYKFVIDTDKKIVNYFYVWTDKEIKRQLQAIEDVIKRNKDKGLKTEHLESLRVMDKINAFKFNINFIDDNYIIGEIARKDKEVFKNTINVFLKKKTVTYTLENTQDNTKRSYTFFCK